MAAVVLITFMILFLTNMMSNAVALILVSTVMLPLIAGGAISGVSGAAVAINIGMAANVAVSTPLASAPAVMSVGTGWLSNSNMLKWGAVMTILTCLIMTFVSYNISLLLILTFSGRDLAGASSYTVFLRRQPLRLAGISSQTLKLKLPGFAAGQFFVGAPGWALIFFVLRANLARPGAAPARQAHSPRRSRRPPSRAAYSSRQVRKIT